MSSIILITFYILAAFICGLTLGLIIENKHDIIKTDEDKPPRI